MVHRASIGLDVHAHSIAAAALHPEDGRSRAVVYAEAKAE